MFFTYLFVEYFSEDIRILIVRVEYWFFIRYLFKWVNCKAISKIVIIIFYFLCLWSTVAFDWPLTSILRQHVPLECHSWFVTLKKKVEFWYLTLSKFCRCYRTHVRSYLVVLLSPGFFNSVANPGITRFPVVFKAR